MIKTANGLMITLQHDVVNPHPYDRINLIAGSKGLFRDYPPRIYLDEQKAEEYAPIYAYKDKYQHSLWKRQGELARKVGGHGGMDFLMVYRLAECMRTGTCTGLRRLRRRGLERAGTAERRIRETGQPADCRPRLHSWTLEGKARVACVAEYMKRSIGVYPYRNPAVTSARELSV